MGPTYQSVKTIKINIRPIYDLPFLLLLYPFSLSLRSPLLLCEPQGIDADEGACGGDRWWMAVTAVGRSTGTQSDKNMECSNVQTFNESKPLLHNNQIYNYLPQGML